MHTHVQVGMKGKMRGEKDLLPEVPLRSRWHRCGFSVKQCSCVYTFYVANNTIFLEHFGALLSMRS